MCGYFSTIDSKLYWKQNFQVLKPNVNCVTFAASCSLQYPAGVLRKLRCTPCWVHTTKVGVRRTPQTPRWRRPWRCSISVGSFERSAIQLHCRRSHNVPVSVEKILLDDVFVKTRFIPESLLQPGSLVGESDEEHCPRGEVVIV